MAQLEFPQDPQARLTAIVEDIDFLTVALHELVAEYIDQGILTWQQVADATGVTRQAAWEKFTHARLGKKRPTNTRS
jgi:hypothetical protein